MGDASVIDKIALIRNILSDYDIRDLLHSVPEDERNFEEKTLEMIWHVVKE